MIRARSTRLVGSVRDREISCKRCRCSASVGSAITRRGATTGSPNPIPPPRLLPHLAQHAKSNPNILIFRNLYTSVEPTIEHGDCRDEDEHRADSHHPCREPAATARSAGVPGGARNRAAVRAGSVRRLSQAWGGGGGRETKKGAARHADC